MTMKIKNSKANYHQICKNNFNEVPKGYCLFVFHLRVQLKRVPIQVFFIKTNLYNRFFLITFRISSIENKTNFSKIFQGETHSTRLPLKSFHVGA